jgi:hypothetical protein
MESKIKSGPVKVAMSNLSNDLQGFAQLIGLYHQLKNAFLEDIHIDMSGVGWLAANMCAPLGAILHQVSSNVNTVSFTDIKPSVEAILRRNGFLSNYGHPHLPNGFGTTVPYQRFETKDDRYFGRYISEHLIGKRIPAMSLGLRKKFQESIFEIFSNAVLHSQTQLGIFSCGQYFRQKQRLDLSISDLGIGLRRNIEQKIGLKLSSEQAIEWALTAEHTTKTGPVPGGLGLKLLREFITMNQGRMQMVSDQGYWEAKGGQVVRQSFAAPFPGTVVNLEFNTADRNSYCLTDEIRPEDIF